MAGQADFLAFDVEPVELRFQVNAPLADPRGALHSDGWGAAVAEIAGRVGQLLFPQLFLALRLFRCHG